MILTDEESAITYEEKTNDQKTFYIDDHADQITLDTVDQVDLEEPEIINPEVLTEEIKQNELSEKQSYNQPVGTDNLDLRTKRKSKKNGVNWLMIAIMVIAVLLLVWYFL